MYKQQSPISVSSTIWALLVTIVVLLIAASASAQTTDTISIDPVPAESASQTNVVAPLPAIPMPDVPTSTTPAPATPIEIRTINTQSLPTNTTSNTTLANPNKVSANATQGNASITSRIQTWRETIKNRRTVLEEKRIALQNSTSSRPALLRAAAQSNITVGVSRITAVLNNAITNSLSINTRLQTKAAELEGRNMDMSAVNVLLTEVGELLNLAMEALEGVSINAQYAVTSDEPMTDWMAVRQQLSEVRDLIQQAHEVMREASAIIKISIRPTDTN